MTEEKRSSPINVVIMGSIFIGWHGGVDFLRNVLNALSIKNETFPVNLYLVLPDNSFLAMARRFASYIWRIVKCLLTHEKPILSFEPTINHASIFDSLENINGEYRTIYYNGTQHSLERALRKVDASVLMLCGSIPGINFPIPWTGYIADFQHKHHPEFFSKQELNRRDIFFERMVKYSSSLIVNSQAVKKDIEKLYPDHRTAVFALPFTPMPIRSWFDPPREDMQVKYRLPDRYFVICNQFWKHKDHKTAFEALAVLHNKFGQQDIKIVCTGKMEDTRFPGYFSSLQVEIEKLGLNGSIIFLGYIPKIDQIQIMRTSIAVIQPTLFEGGPGGGAIFDSVALGIPSIVSDIEINKEIDDKSVHFFQVGNSRDLSEKMLNITSQARPIISAEIQFSAAEARLGKYMETLIGSIKYALQ